MAKYSTAYNYDQTLTLAATALGIVGSIAIGRYATPCAAPVAD